MAAPDNQITPDTGTRARQAQVQVWVLLCHFLSAFTALGMPLFLPRMLAVFDTRMPSYLVGVLFVLPGVCTALAAGWWGRFADRYGKRVSLLRAHLGLSFGFIICSYANSIGVFALGLVAQGLCGGTLAASNAYLSGMLRDKQLAQSLNLTQVSARLALLLGPIVLGLFTDIENPLLVYRYLALLPLAALLITFVLPDEGLASKPHPTKQHGVSEWNRGLTIITVLQFFFCFSMVVTFPYFLRFTEQLGLHNDSLIGLFFSLPHLVYLALVFVIGKLSWKPKSQALSGLIALGLACVGHYFSTGPLELFIARIVFGIGMVLTYNGVHRLLSEWLIPGSAGFIFGRFDASGKWAGVSAGLVAGLLVYLVDPIAPFIAAALSAALGILLLIKQNAILACEGSDKNEPRVSTVR